MRKPAPTALPSRKHSTPRVHAVQLRESQVQKHPKKLLQQIREPIRRKHSRLAQRQPTPPGSGATSCSTTNDTPRTKRPQPPGHTRSGWRKAAHDQGQENVAHSNSRGRDDSRDVVDGIVSTQVAGSRDDGRVLRAADSRRGGLYGDGDGTPAAGR